MANNVQTAEPSVPSLLGGIIQDLERLLTQQFTLFRREVQQDMGRTRQAATILGIGVVIALLAGVMLSMTVAFLLQWLNPEMPLWGCFAIVGGFLALVGAGLIYLGKKQFDSFNPLPDESAQALKENVQWLTTTPK